VDAALVPGAHELGLEPALAGVAAVLRTLPAAPLDLVISADGVAPAAVELPAALHGAVAELLPSSAVTSAAAAAGLVGVLGFALLLLLACSRGRPALVRVPPSPVFETDTSPA
jgi:hypothetical protein